MGASSRPKCKCRVCGLVFESYVKVELCMKHYWEDRDEISKIDPETIRLENPI